MALLQDWGGAVSDAWSNIITRVINFVPNIVGAVLILVLGWIVAILLAKIVDQILRWLQLPTVFKEAKIEDLVKKTGAKLDTVGLISALVKWILILVVFIAAVETLKLTSISSFLDTVLGYAPAVVAAAGIFLVGVILAHFLGNVVEGAVRAAELSHAGTLGSIARWSVWVFTLLAVLSQLGIAEGLIRTLFTGFVAMLAIGGGLAFGLGGQGVAREVLEKLKKDLEK